MNHSSADDEQLHGPSSLADRAGEKLRAYQARSGSVASTTLSPAFLVAGAQQLQRLRTRRNRIMASAAAACSTLLLVWSLSGLNAEAERYAVNSRASTSALNQPVVGETGGSQVQFAGATMTLSEGGAMRVEELRERGAAVRLDHGVLHCEVSPEAHGEWTVHAGDYQVRVIGTVFDVVWSPESGHFETSVVRGVVEVVGARIEGVRRLSAGGMLVIEGAAATDGAAATEVDATNTENIVEESGETRQTSPPSPNGVDSANGSSGSRQKESDAQVRPSAGDWRALANTGKYSASMAAIDAAGYESTIAQLSVEDLLAVSDVARMAGKSQRASELLHQVRSRAPGSSSAALAAYSLGSTAFDQRGDSAGAARWFEIYLREAPSGPLAQEALGRLMEAQHRSGAKEVASKTAARYLKRYPTGAHQSLALTLINSAVERK